MDDLGGNQDYESRGNLRTTHLDMGRRVVGSGCKDNMNVVIGRRVHDMG